MATSNDLGVLRARLIEVEPGLFKAEYVEDDRERQEAAISAPDQHIGMDRDGVRNFVEEYAERAGYSAVRWEEDSL